MAVILPNPDNVPGQVTTGYQAQNTVLYASMTGFCNINLNGDNMSAGSVFELNGALFVCAGNETIHGLNEITHSVFFYIYAEPDNAGNVQFHARAGAPAWNTEKGGYYISNNRALIKAVKYQNGNAEAVKMNSILSNVNSVTPPNSGGAEVIDKRVRAHEAWHGQAGWYRYEMQSGLGRGNGGSGGGVPSVSNSITGVFYHGGGAVIIHVGGNGYNGGGKYGANNTASGGGSGAGEETYIISGPQKFSTERTMPGNGGGANGGFGVLDEIAAHDVNYRPGEGGIGGSGRDYGQPGGGYGNNEKGKTLGFGWGGGGGGAVSGDYTYAGGGGGAPGWTRPLGDTAAGYCKLFYIGL